MISTLVFLGGYYLKPESVFTHVSVFGKNWPIPKTLYNTHQISEHVELYTPVSSDCLSWDLPLPSGPARPLHLELRNKDDLREGFLDRRINVDK